MTDKCREEVAIATRKLTEKNNQFEQQLYLYEQALKKLGVNLDDLVKDQNMSNDNDMELD